MLQQTAKFSVSSKYLRQWLILQLCPRN